MTARGWWRRNIWALLLLVPLLAAQFYGNVDLWYERNYTQQPMEQAPVDATGRAAIDDFAIRVIEITAVKDDKELEAVTRFGHPAPPRSVTVWRAIVTVEGPAEGGVKACVMSLVDAQGREFHHGPVELGGDSLGTGFACYPDDDDQPAPYTSTAYFLLPADVTPTALVITWPARLPRFIRFDIP